MKVATERTGAMYSFHVYQNAPQLPKHNLKWRMNVTLDTESPLAPDNYAKVIVITH